MAAVLLRRVFLQLEHKDLVDDLQADSLVSCQAELLMAIRTETNVSIRRKICDAVAELARSCIGMSVGMLSTNNMWEGSVGLLSTNDRGCQWACSVPMMKVSVGLLSTNNRV